jgi:hypothetical protein
LFNVVLLNFIIYASWFVCLFIFCCVVDGNETVSDENDNNGKGKGKFEWKLVSDYENVEQLQQGMMFSSINELFSYSRRFGQKSGFGVVQKKLTKDKITGENIRITLACERNPSVRIEYKAKLNTKFVETKLYVTSVTIEHNHALSPNKERYFKSNMILNTNMRRKIIVNDISRIGLSQSYNSLAVEVGGRI